MNVNRFGRLFRNYDCDETASFDIVMRNASRRQLHFIPFQRSGVILRCVSDARLYVRSSWIVTWKKRLHREAPYLADSCMLTNYFWLNCERPGLSFSMYSIFGKSQNSQKFTEINSAINPQRQNVEAYIITWSDIIDFNFRDQSFWI